MFIMLVITAPVYWLKSPYKADNFGNCTQVTTGAKCILSNSPQMLETDSNDRFQKIISFSYHYDSVLYYALRYAIHHAKFVEFE